MEGQGLTTRTTVLLGTVFGLVGGAWFGSKLAHETIFLGLWSGMLAAAGALAGCWVGYMIGKHL